MIAVNPNSICEQARAYYYDYLRGEAREHIPLEMLAHLDKCRFCRAEVGRLKSMLAEAEARATEGTRQTTSTVVANLRLHFAYTGARVACNTVKPFLPSLAIPALDVGVPTPITVHLDKCQQCANDLEVIRHN
jgi:predicted anti-sigma-YlaC factor YlaD